VDLGIAGKRALVLASSRGLGLATARVLAREGVQVILCGRDEARLASAVRSIVAEGGTAARVHADLSQPYSIAALNDAAEQKFGGVDILVNNVGGPPAKPISTVSIDEWQQEFDAMVGSVLRITGHFLPAMRAAKWGRIITIASSGVVQPIPNLGISNALRSSLVGWSKTLSAEVAADGVTVNMILPGRIQTERVDDMDALVAKQQNKSVAEIARASHASIPMGRYGTVEEFAAVAVFLASDRASYVTGSLVRVDGGYIRSI
jgi:3-oxoacyl-[acyl-carrier protein] reductase